MKLAFGFLYKRQQKFIYNYTLSVKGQQSFIYNYTLNVKGAINGSTFRDFVEFSLRLL